jgi:DNA adenine methylase
VGGGSIIKLVKGNRIASDNNRYLIALYQAIQRGYIPPENVTEQQYALIKNNKEQFPDHLVGFVGFGCSFGGKWFNGYARYKERNFARESRDNLLGMLPSIMGVTFQCCDYRVYNPNGYFIYCDPPYSNTTKYKDSFNSEEFWGTVKQWSKKNIILVSEYSSPFEDRCIWTREIKSTVSLDKSVKLRVEKLYLLTEQKLTSII